MQADQSEPLLLWIVLTPLLGALFNGLLGPRLPRGLVKVVASATLPVALYCAYSAAKHGSGLGDVAWSHPWIDIGPVHLQARLMLDTLSMLFVAIICGVGTLIHVFSWSYMDDEPGLARFFAYLNFFCAAMLLLVLADALPLMFVGWEGVGLASYLLIGFYFHESFRVQAAQKAFIFNRVGDAALLIAMFVLVRQIGTLDFAGIDAAAARGLLSPLMATTVVLLAGLGVAGKSAQLPLFVWLPDAMVGPTPASALIHAATMVTAGVYLLARLGSILVLSPVAMAVLGVVGASTALFAALCAAVQDDIKRVLAYSTVSQLGYMVMVAAIGAAPLALFHVTTHAFFKACLFLGAAALIHAQHGEQDMRRMGGLAAAMPLVALSFVIAALALCGVPPLSGFASKDAILGYLLAMALDPAQPLAPVAQLMWLFGLATAGLTAFYMARTVLLTFFSGPFRGPASHAAHLHDAPWPMALPLAALAALSLMGGLLAWPHALGGQAWLTTLLSEALHVSPKPPAPLTESVEYLSMGLSVGVALVGFGLAALTTRKITQLASATTNRWRQALSHSGGVDALYAVWFSRPYSALASRFLPRWLEHHVVQGGPRWLSRLVSLASFALQLLHSGNVQRGLAVLVLASALMLYGWLLPVAPFAPVLSHALSALGAR